MEKDTVLEKVRKVRHEISEQCDHDTKKFIDYYIKYQKKYEKQLIKSTMSREIKSIKL